MEEHKPYHDIQLNDYHWEGFLLTTVLAYGNDKFCSVVSDTQITNSLTFEPTNGLPKVIKVSNKIIIALSGNVECFVKIFGWEYMKFPARKREFKRYFNSNFQYHYADDCFDSLSNFAKDNIHVDCNIFVFGQNSTGGMFYGKISTDPYSLIKEVSDLKIYKYSDLPNDLDKSKNEGRYDRFMQELDKNSLNHDCRGSFISEVQRYQALFINRIALESKFSNNEICSEIIQIE